MGYFKRVSIAILLLAIPFLETTSQAAELNLRTEKIYFTASFPKDFCLLNREYTRDAFLMDYLQTISGKSMKLMGTALPCSELESYRQGKMHLPSSSLSLFQVGVDGHFTRFLLGKRIFNKLITSFSLDENLERIKKRTNDKLSRFDDSLIDLKAQIANHKDTDVVVVKGQAQIAYSQETSKAFNVTATSTLVHKYPFVAIMVAIASEDSNLAKAENDTLELLSSMHRR